MATVMATAGKGDLAAAAAAAAAAPLPRLTYYYYSYHVELLAGITGVYLHYCRMRLGMSRSLR